MKRRDFLKLSTVGASLPILGTTVGCSEDQLTEALNNIDPDLQALQPTRVESKDGVLDYKMSIEMGKPFVNGLFLDYRTYNGVFPPETLVVKPGETMKIHLVNNLPKSAEDNYHPNNINIPHGFNNINLHTHGLNVSPAADEDNVLIEIKPGEEFEYSIKIPEDHPSGTFWYHPHKHGSALHQLASGMAGFLMIEGGDDDLKEIPEIKAATSIDLAFHELIFAPNGRVPAEGNGEAEEKPVNKDPNIEARNPIVSMFKFEAGLYYTINGLSIDNGNGDLPSNGKVAYIRMQPGEVQHWRLGLHCHLQGYRFILEEHDLNIAGWDGITAHKMEVYPPEMDAEEKLILGPANRVDILVKANMKPGAYKFKMVTEQFGENPLFTTPRFGKSELTMFNVIVEGEPKDMALPATLNPPEKRLPQITDDEIVRRREVRFRVTGDVTFDDSSKFVEDDRKYYINGLQFDANRTNETMVLDTAEEWTIHNDHNHHLEENKHPFPQINHPFHIHVNWFQLMELHHHNGTVTKFDGVEHPIRWMDSIDVPFGGKAIVRHRFENFTGRFVFHCHIIAHEDEGMMNLIEVVDGKPIKVEVKAGESGTLMSEDYSKMDPKTKAWLEARNALPPIKVKAEFPAGTFGDTVEYTAAYEYKTWGYIQGSKINNDILLYDPMLPNVDPEKNNNYLSLERYFKLSTDADTTELKQPIIITINYPKKLSTGYNYDHTPESIKLFYGTGDEDQRNWSEDNLTKVSHDVIKGEVVYKLEKDLGDGYFGLYALSDKTNDILEVPNGDISDYGSHGPGAV